MSIWMPAPFMPMVYYTPKLNDSEARYLAAFKDSDGNGLTMVDTDGDGVADSYDISGKSELIEIVEEEVPQTELPEIVEFEDIPDENIPLAQIPVIGDTSALFGCMSAFSALGLTVMPLLGRKKRDEE